MKKLFRQILLVFLTIVVFSGSVVTASAIDPVSAAVPEAAACEYEMVITSDSINVTVGKTAHLSAEVTGVKEQPEIVWKSLDPAVAEVDENGTVKALKIGRVLIAASAEIDGETTESVYRINVVSKNDLHKDIFSQYNVLSYRYSYIDDVYYADDKVCWQKYFGFGRIYDLLAPYIAFEYDYTRVFYTYEGRDYIVQLWKGQYGAALYGGEIGIYSKKASDKEPGVFTFFGTAKEDEQPNMEVTIYHQKPDGKWEREFTRDYGKYWWCTGFKVGHLRQVEPADELRMVGRLTFENEEIAKLFADGLVECGFAKAPDKDKMGLDTFCIEGSDVYVKWQNISEAENTMPLKIGATVLLVSSFLAKIISTVLTLCFGGIILLLIFGI